MTNQNLTVGDLVQISGLTSQTGMKWNSKIGGITKILENDRFGVEIDGETKSVHARNLSKNIVVPRLVEAAASTKPLRGWRGGYMGDLAEQPFSTNTFALMCEEMGEKSMVIDGSRLRTMQNLAKSQWHVIEHQQTGTCILCKGEAAPRNYDDKGKKQYQMTGLCGVCFDDAFDETKTRRIPISDERFRSLLILHQLCRAKECLTTMKSYYDLMKRSLSTSVD